MISSGDFSNLTFGGQPMEGDWSGGGDPGFDSGFGGGDAWGGHSGIPDLTNLEMTDPGSVQPGSYSMDAYGNVVDQTGNIIVPATEMGAAGSRPVEPGSLPDQQNPDQPGTPGAFSRTAEFLKNSPWGRALATLLFGGAGIGIAQGISGGTPNFRVPQPPQTAGQKALSDLFASDPAAAEQLKQIIMTGLNDPVTAALRKQILSITEGGTTNPALERQFQEQKDVLQNKMFTAEGPQWEMSTPGIDASTKLTESQHIQNYQDWLNTIKTLTGPYQAGTGQELNLASGIGGIDATNRQGLNTQSAQDNAAWLSALMQRQSRDQLGAGIGSLIGRAGANAFSLAA